MTAKGHNCCVIGCPFAGAFRCEYLERLGRPCQSRMCTDHRVLVYVDGVPCDHCPTHAVVLERLEAWG